jgi:hypothetical protein
MHLLCGERAAGAGPLPKQTPPDVRHALLAVEGIFLLRGMGFLEFSAEEHRSVLLHARDI